MVRDRLWIDSHGFGDHSDRMALGEQAQHFEFACGQTVSLVDALAFVDTALNIEQSE
jgi:hypothetical protein